MMLVYPVHKYYFISWPAGFCLVNAFDCAWVAVYVVLIPYICWKGCLAMANISNSPITQVSQVPTHTNLQPQLLTRLLLDLRGRRFEVDRETIMNLPESVLLCLFPNGLVLSRQSMALSEGGGEEEEEDLYAVDVGQL